MQTKMMLGHSDATQIIAAAEAKAVQNDWAVTIAVVDDGGHLLHLARLDGAPLISLHLATEKARTSALGRRESKSYEDMVNEGRISFLSVTPLTSIEGGVPLMFKGQIVGAIGVSGVKSDQDAAVAM